MKLVWLTPLGGGGSSWWVNPGQVVSVSEWEGPPRGAVVEVVGSRKVFVEETAWRVVALLNGESVGGKEASA